MEQKEINKCLRLKLQNFKAILVNEQGLITLKEVSRYEHSVRQLALKKEREYQKGIATFGSIESILSSNQYNVKVELE